MLFDQLMNLKLPQYIDNISCPRVTSCKENTR